ncbi:MAG: glycoside hydrolase family 2, partial [Marinilabiliales bacterium]|nr:glycoside hydrolase family 2 [Marinilabiliales bacterium]
MKSALVRHLILLFLLWLSTDLFAFAGEPTRHSFDFGWKFSLGDHPEASQPEINDQAWRTLDVPHDFSLELPFDPNNPSGGEGGYAYGGIGWYRKHFVLEESMKDQKISVLFNGIYRNSEVWINGHYLGFRPYGYTSFQYDLTPFLNPAGQDNVMSVKVNTSQQPNSRWYTGAGIFRHVWLLATGNIHFEPWGIFVHTLHTDPR